VLRCSDPIFHRPSHGGTSLRARLKAGVVGAGVFGGYHAQKYAALPGVGLAAVLDASAEAAGKAAERHGAKAVQDLSEFAKLVDVATIATPATTHYVVARELLDAGVHVLVEKPLALTVDEADDLIARAKARGLTLQAGHQERFVVAATGLLDRGKSPRSISCRRAGPWTGRCTDVGVVFDLMIHDLDLCHQLADGLVNQALADGRAKHGADADEVMAELHFADGCQANLYASRISELRERTLTVEYDDGTVEIDFIKRTIANTTPARLTPLGKGNKMQRAIATDPLGYAVGEFVRAVKAGHEPYLNGQTARRALATALMIVDRAERRQAA
jgi:predicted dehydrogenase